jgi:hypothetical protein
MAAGYSSTGSKPVANGVPAEGRQMRAVQSAAHPLKRVANGCRLKAGRALRTRKA